MSFKYEYANLLASFTSAEFICYLLELWETFSPFRSYLEVCAQDSTWKQLIVSVCETTEKLSSAQRLNTRVSVVRLNNVNQDT